MQQLIAWSVKPLVIGGIVAAMLAAVSAPSAAAKPRKRADVSVTIDAPRNILPGDGSSTVSAYVRNIGNAPAAGVRVKLTLPEPFRQSHLSTSADWNCDHITLTEVGCSLIGELAAGAEAYPVTLSASLYGAVAGTSLTAQATVTTTSRESATANNEDSQRFQIVGYGIIQGVYWHDRDADGVRESDEPLVDPMSLSVWSVDDEDLYGFSNSFGPYQLTVPAKRYYVDVELITASWRFTTPNVGDDDADSDPVPYRETAYTQYARVEAFVVDPTRPTTIDVGVVAAR